MTEEKMSEYYEARASEYEQIYYREVPERRREIDEEVERFAGLCADCDLVELACGTGYWTQTACQTAKSVLASDLSMSMIVEAQKKGYSPTVPNFIRADLNRLPFRSGQFDLVALGFWFSHHPKQDYDGLFDKIIPLLRPEGKIWMIDNNPPAEGDRNDSVGRDEFGNNYKTRWLDSGEKFVILKNYFKCEELQAIFSERFKIESLIYGRYYWSVVLSSE